MMFTRLIKLLGDNLMNKKILVALFVIFAVLLSISTVCANNVTSDINAASAVDESSICEDSVDDNEYSSFTSLESTINGSDVINLTTNYRFNNGSDNFKGISIKKDNLIINGNGRIIDGNNQSMLFTICANNITINDLILINGNSRDCGAIYI